MLRDDHKLMGLAHGDLVKKLAESKNISLEQARKEISSISFKDYLTLIENIVPPSGKPVGSATGANKIPSLNPPASASSSLSSWKGGNQPIELGMQVDVVDDQGKPLKAQVTQVDRAAGGVRVTDPTTGKTEWINKDLLDPTLQTNEDADIHRLKELAGIQESSSAGATGAGAIAVAPTYMGSMNKRQTTESPKKEYKPKSPPKTIVGDTKPGQASGELSATLAANGKKTATRANNGFKK